MTLHPTYVRTLEKLLEREHQAAWECQACLGLEAVLWVCMPDCQAC